MIIIYVGVIMKFLTKFLKKAVILVIFLAFQQVFSAQVSSQTIKYIGFDIHDVLIHLNIEKGSRKPMDYQAIVISAAQQVKNECQFDQNSFANVTKSIGVVMKNSMPKLLPQLLSWVSAAAEQGTLGQVWFAKHFIVTLDEISASVEQITSSDAYNKFVDQLLADSINSGVSELAGALNTDPVLAKTKLTRILKNGLIKSISSQVVKGFFDITGHARMAEAIQPMLKLIKTLKNTGYTLFIISNAAIGIVKEQYKQKPELAELFACFEDNKIIVSGEVGIKKPDHAIFRHAATVVGFEFSECLFVDDEAQNIASACELGITGIQFDRKNISEFLNTLKNISIINSEDIKEILGEK